MRTGELKQPSRAKAVTALDLELEEAKASEAIVKITLPFETDYSDSKSTCRGYVQTVDTFSVCFRIEGKEIWINKSFVVAIEIMEPVGSAIGFSVKV